MSRDHSLEGSSAVGRELRDAREALGITVSDMADALRIRAAHIEALEDGRFSDLPGRPYTLGFARSIARHLGLDPDAVAMRLRDEVTGVARPVELVFPESTEDKRLSRAGWIAISLLLVAVAYGAWLTLSPSDNKGPPEFAASSSSPVVPEVIPPESDSAATEVEDKTPETTVDAAPAEPPAEPAPPVVTGTAPPTQAAPSPAARVAPQAPSGTVPAGPAPSVQPAAPSATARLAPSQGHSAAPSSSVPSASAPPRNAERQVTPPAGSPAPAAGAAGPASGPAPSAAAADEEEEDVTPEPSSVASAPSLPSGRITLRARQDSWVQIQAANGVTVMARTLRAGESYTVPEQGGLRLTTGNAGALEVIVDGQLAPSLGQVGAVRRNVTLDPARLKSGTALE